jgi:transposase
MAKGKTSKAQAPTIWEIAEAGWPIVQRMLDEHDPPKPKGPQRVALRRVLNGLSFRLRTGCPWNQLPTQFGDDSPVHRPFQRWCELGLFARLWAVLVPAWGELGGVDWRWQAADAALGNARLGGDWVGRHPTARGNKGGNAALSGKPRAVHVGGPWREPMSTRPHDARRRSRPWSSRGQRQRPRRLNIVGWRRATIIPRAIKQVARIMTRGTSVRAARKHSLHARASGTQRGAGAWNEPWQGSQRAVRCWFATTSLPGTSWGCFRWQVPCSGSVEELGSSVIEIVSKKSWRRYSKVPPKYLM